MLYYLLGIKIVNILMVFPSCPFSIHIWKHSLYYFKKPDIFLSFSFCTKWHCEHCEHFHMSFQYFSKHYWIENFNNCITSIHTYICYNLFDHSPILSNYHFVTFAITNYIIIKSCLLTFVSKSTGWKNMSISCLCLIAFQKGVASCPLPAV